MKRVDPEAIAVRRNTVTVVTSKPTDKNKSRKKDRSYKINLNKLDDEKIFGKSEVRMFQSLSKNKTIMRKTSIKSTESTNK